MTPSPPDQSDNHSLEATHLLLAAGFTCPFLIPSFFLSKRVPNAGTSSFKSIAQSRWRISNRANGVNFWRSHSLLEHSNTVARGSAIGGGRKHPFTWQFYSSLSCERIRPSGIPSLPTQSCHISLIHASNRLFSTTNFNYGPTRKNSRKPSKVVRPAKASKSGPRESIAALRRVAQEKRFGKRRKSGHGSKKPINDGVVYTPITMQPPKPPPAVKKPSPSSSSEPKTTKRRPSWIKAGVPRTKVKATGRKARRQARKLARKSSGEEKMTEAAEDEILGRTEINANAAEVMPSKFSAIGPEAKMAPKSMKASPSAPKLISLKPEKTKTANVALPEPQISDRESIVTKSGSRIAIRGQQVDLTLGRGRKVSGRSVIIPGPAQRRIFSTFSQARGEDKDIGIIKEKGLSTVKVNTLLPEDSAIPKSQILQAENSPIIEDNQAAHTPPEESATTENAGPNLDPNSTTTTVQSHSDPSINNDNSSSKPGQSYKEDSNLDKMETVNNDISKQIRTKSTVGETIVHQTSPERSSHDSTTVPEDENANLDVELSDIIGSQSKVSYPPRLIPFPSKMFPKRQKPPMIPPAPPAPQISKLLSYILSSPHLQPQQKRSPKFWVDIFEKWYLPKRVQDRLPKSKIPTVDQGNKLGSVDLLFTQKYIAPGLPDSHVKCGASANDVILLIEEAAINGIDLLVELGRIGHYSAVRWTVRRILHTQVFDVIDLEDKHNDVLGFFDQEKYPMLDPTTHASEHISLFRAGDIGLDHLISYGMAKRKVVRVKQARQGLGIILRSIGIMLIQADPMALSSAVTLPSPFSPSYTYGVADDKNKTLWKTDYTLLLPLSKEILAYLHNCSLIPQKLYSGKLNLRLSILRQRILTSLADAVCQHQDLAAAGRNNPSMEEDSDLGMSEDPSKRWSIYGYWRGGFEALAGKSSGNFWKKKSENKQQEKAKAELLAGLENVANRGEREVLLELILRICVLSGFGLTGTDIFSRMVRQGGWSFIDYEATWPEEYRAEDLALREEDEILSNLPGQWGVRGYGIMAPPIRTQKMTLPQDLLKAIPHAIVDSMGEGKGLSAVIQGLYQLSRLFGAAEVGISTSSSKGILAQVIKLWEDNAAIDPRGPAIGEELLGHIQFWSNADERSQSEISPGEIHTELRIWYQVLQAYCDLENVEGATRVWEDLQARMYSLVPNNFEPIYAAPGTKDWEQEVQDRFDTHYFHPPWVLGPYLAILNRGDQVRKAVGLLQTPRRAPFPIIPPHYYNLPPVTPHLLTLASLTKDYELANEVVSSLPLKVPKAVPHSTLSSLVNTYLRLGNFDSAQDVVEYMESMGMNLDGTDIGILVENALRQNPDQGYAFVEQTEQANKPPVLGKQKVHSRWGDWTLPHKYAAGLIHSMSATAAAAAEAAGDSSGPKKPMKFTSFEGILISQTETKKALTPKQQARATQSPKMSPSGWISVLNNSIDVGDRERAEWALNALGVDIRKKQAISTKVFNILLKGVVRREGSIVGWVMVNAHCIRDRVPSVYNQHHTLRSATREGGRGVNFQHRGAGAAGQGGEWRVKIGQGGREWQWVHAGKEQWGVRPDLITYKTVLDRAVREVEELEEMERSEWEMYVESFGVAPPEVAVQVKAEAREATSLSAAGEWNGNSSARGSGGGAKKKENEVAEEEEEEPWTRYKSPEEIKAEMVWKQRQQDRVKKRATINHVMDQCRQRMNAMSGL